MHVFPWVFQGADILSTIKHLVLKEQDFSKKDKERHLMILGRRYDGLYASGNVMFRVNNNEDRII